MRCLDCRYSLKGLTEPRCPEGGREFDPGNPETFGPRPPRPLAYWLRWLFIVAMLGLLLFVGAFMEHSGPDALADLDVKIAKAARITLGRWLIFVAMLFGAWLLYEAFKSAHSKAPPPAKFARTPSAGTHLSAIVNRKSETGDSSID